MRAKSRPVRKTARKNKLSQKQWGRGAGRWLRRLVLWIVYAIILYQFWLLFHVLYWKHNDPKNTAFMQGQLEIIREDRPEAIINHQWVSYRQISYDMKRAIIVAEDSKFLLHHGFDYDSLWNAFKKNLEQGSVSVGGSTISQQLAKNLFLTEKRSILRKIQEAVITVMLETVMSKQRILEIYLNVIEWGNGVFGVEAAAQYYFGQPAVSLNAEQATYLAAMVTNPRYYDTHRQSKHLLKKRDILLNRLHSAKIP